MNGPRWNSTIPGAVLDTLKTVVDCASYKLSWTFEVRWLDRTTEHLAGTTGWTLVVTADVIDSSWPPHGAECPYCMATPPTRVHVEHWFNVPSTSWDRQTWERWLLDRILEVERHEAMEFYRVDGVAPYFPAHGPGKDPYEIVRAPTDGASPQREKT